MLVIPIDVDIALPEDGAIDLFFLQCYSPEPVENGLPVKLPANISVCRETLLTRFCQWLQDKYFPNNPPRPYFVVLPELAVSLSHLSVLEDIAQLGERPAGVFAGLEFLTPDEYSSIIQDMPDMPQLDTWTEGITAAHRMNAALILLNQSNGQFLQFIQPKRNPSDMEATTHFNCQNALFFRSMDQTQGKRLNFCIQICSDFTDFEDVQDFRRECETVVEGRPLDFTFLLQRNKKQFAQQFVRSIHAYFSSANGMVDTSRGCLVFANTASEVAGKSKDWGKSMLLFPWNSIHWRTYGSATYWLRDDKHNNYQAVVLREPGACIYWLRYKPHYLVNREAGSGQPGPFVDNHALSLKLDGEIFPDQPSFHAIQAETHWLLSEWSQCKSGFIQQLISEDVPDSVVTSCEIAHDATQSAWVEALLPDEQASRYTLDLYFSSSKHKLLVNNKREPQEWSATVADNARHFLDVFTLLRCGFPGQGLMPQPRKFAHAILNEETNLSLIYGDNRSVSSIIVNSLSVIASAGLTDKAKHILVLLSPLDSPDSNKLRSIAKESLRNYTDAADSPADGIDNITSADELGEIVPVLAQGIWSSVLTASNMTEIKERIPVLLGMGTA